VIALGKVVGYIRVSTDEQVANGQGLQIQEKELKEYCRKNKLEMVKLFRDEGVSGANDVNKRKGLNDLLEYCRNHKDDAIPGRAMLVTDPTSPYFGQRLLVTDDPMLGRGYANYGNNWVGGWDTGMVLYTEWADLVPDPANPGFFGIGIDPALSRSFKNRFVEHAWHELGHSLGIADGYAGAYNTSAGTPVPIVPAALSPGYDIMNYNYSENTSAGVGYVESTNLHILMILNSSRYFEWQLYEYYDINRTRDSSINPKYAPQVPATINQKR